MFGPFLAGRTEIWLLPPNAQGAPTVRSCLCRLCPRTTHEVSAWDWGTRSHQLFSDFDSRNLGNLCKGQFHSQLATTRVDDIWTSSVR